MPIYEFYCPSCRQRFERMLPIARATEPAFCAAGHQASRALSAFAVGRTGEMPAPQAGGSSCACGGGGCGCGR